MKVISRKDARAQNLKTYFTGEPCTHGHIAMRSVIHGRCTECEGIRVKRWRKSSPEHARLLAREYGRRKRLTPEGRAHLVAIQRKARHKRDGIPTPPYPAPHHCELCHQCKKLVIDHDHKTGCFRGWICNTCNRALGMLGDTHDRLTAAADYLLRAELL